MKMVALSKQTFLFIVVLSIFIFLDLWESERSMTLFTAQLTSHDNLSEEPDCHVRGKCMDTISRRPLNPFAESSVLLYPKNPQAFTDKLLQCLDQPKCHVLYHHIPKTAGTFIASSLHPVYESGDPYRSGEWCCYEKVMEKFWKKKDHYCARRKIGIYEVWGDEFAQVLETCEQEYSGDGHTYVALVSTREPIQRTISLIHQQCNSGYDKKNPKYQAFCRNCTYDDPHSKDSKVFWDRFIDDTNKAYTTMQDYLTARKAVRPQTLNSASSPVLVIDNSMVNDLFSRMDIGLNKRKLPKIKLGKANPENRSICSFGMTSQTFQLLRPSSSVFLDVWSGFDQISG